MDINNYIVLASSRLLITSKAICDVSAMKQLFLKGSILLYKAQQYTFLPTLCSMLAYEETLFMNNGFCGSCGIYWLCSADFQCVVCIKLIATCIIELYFDVW